VLWFIIAMLVACIAVVLIVVDRGLESGHEMKSAGTLAGISLLVIAAVVTLCDMATAVSANSVGIETKFGRPVGTLQSGLHFLAPWADVQEFSTRVQVTDRQQSAQGDVPGADCVQVNLKGGASACADVAVRYVINPTDAIDLWRRYGDFDTVRDRLLRTATDNAAKLVYGQFDPQSAISGDALPQLTAGLTKELTNQLASSGLTLVAIAPGQLHLSPDVQQRINDVLNAATQTQIAQQTLARNQAQAAANQALQGSLSQQVLIQQCIEAAKEIHPAVFDCWPGNAATPLVNVSR
jgi:regulator of protease activity HflC (stomatin/prohibitin superfamily)